MGKIRLEDLEQFEDDFEEGRFEDRREKNRKREVRTKFKKEYFNEEQDSVSFRH